MQISRRTPHIILKAIYILILFHVTHKQTGKYQVEALQTAGVINRKSSRSNLPLKSQRILPLV